MILFTVVVPTYRRPQDLLRCLDALKQQSRPADEVIVTVRDVDTETWKALETYDFKPLPLTLLTIAQVGVIAAMNAGLEASKGDIVAFTDDDAAPHTDWVQRIEQHFIQNPAVGGVGGRDDMYHDGVELVKGEKETVGCLQWFGRVVGNHHLGVGDAREVDVLKGVNMSFRRTAIGELNFDQRMRGTGAQVHFEIAFSLTLKRAGWLLIYDPQIRVDHFQARRFDEDQRNQFNKLAYLNAVHNETVALLDHFSPIRQLVFLTWAVLVGTRQAFGIVQLFRFLPQEGSVSIDKWLASLQGRWQGWRTWRNTQAQLPSKLSNSSA